MIKYVLKLENKRVEFESEQERTTFLMNNLDWQSALKEEFDEIDIPEEIDAQQIVLKDIEKGRQVIISYLADNKKMMLTPSQDIYQMQNFADIKALLEVGAIQTAKYLISQLPIDDILTEERKIKYLSML